ncbi:MAG TPA: preprotein translocase subunit SecG [Planctomycetota bacterium]|nr:preprotein translocase subunit SecG [Planctomycetota bacterium]
MMIMFLSIVLLAICVFLVFLVLSQDVKGGGLAGALGGGAVQSAFGGRSAESITRLTAWVALAFFLLVLVMGLIGGSSTIGLRDSDVEDAGVPTSTDP